MHLLHGGTKGQTYIFITESTNQLNHSTYLQSTAMWTHKLAVQRWPHPCLGSWLPQSTPTLRFQQQAVQHNTHTGCVVRYRSSVWCACATGVRWQDQQHIELITCHGHQVHLLSLPQHGCCTPYKACMCWLYQGACEWQANSKAAPRTTHLCPHTGLQSRRSRTGQMTPVAGWHRTLQL